MLLDSPILGRGFRPFFLLGAAYSVLNLLIWGGFYAGYITPPTVFSDPVSWHAHEMIYGFALAIVAGFLLTAVANWTGCAPARQLHLAGLCALWLVGRIVMNFDLGLPDSAVFITEGAFIPALAISLSIPLLKSRNKRNFVFLALLTILFSCDIVFLVTEDRTPLTIAVMVIVSMISLVGGRVIPAFTVAALRRRGEEAFQTPQNTLDILALLSLVLIILALVFVGTQGLILAGVAFTSAIIHLLRMRRYHTQKILNDPMVWILHIGYIWVIAGLFLIGLAGLNILPFSTALHALTAGAIGSMTLGMMCRVALGHTGRNLIATKATTTSFILMQTAAFMRVLGPVSLPDHINLWIIGSAFLWAACYIIYIFVYVPTLWQPRPDGRPA
ncbi:MAG: short-chain dehydrogenase [Micavibrio sp.]|nr:MAG: short-chain dehydrogenase [Micavibrio sp.]